MAQVKNSLGYIEDFIDEVDRAKDLDDLYSAMMKQIKRQGFESFIYRLIVAQNGTQPVYYLSSIPQEWKDRYKNLNYGKDDIVARHIGRTMRPFNWLEICPWNDLTDAQRNIMNEARVFGITSGGTVPIHGVGHTKALVSVTNNLPPEKFAPMFLHERHAIHLVATYFHERIVQMYPSSPRSSGFARLSSRELEMLTWTAAGKQPGEIADILNLSTHTVKEYIQNCCRKLNVVNKTQAIAVALIQGLISP